MTVAGLIGKRRVDTVINSFNVLGEFIPARSKAQSENIIEWENYDTVTLRLLCSGSLRSNRVFC